MSCQVSVADQCRTISLNLDLLAVARCNAAVLITELQNMTFKTFNFSDLHPNQFLRLRCHFLLLQTKLRLSVTDLWSNFLGLVGAGSTFPFESCWKLPVCSYDECIFSRACMRGWKRVKGGVMLADLGQRASWSPRRVGLALECDMPFVS